MNKIEKIISIFFVIVVIGFIVSVFISPRAQKPINTVSYSCNSDKTIIAAYYEGVTKPPAGPDMPPTPGGSVALKLSDGRSMTLTQTISADGARYANKDESFVFWSKGNGAIVLENGQEKSFIGCILVAPEPTGVSLPQIYSNSKNGFSIRLPIGYTTDESYVYQELGPGKNSAGVKFTIPSSVATGTNLGEDSYISVEEVPQSVLLAKECSAAFFVDPETSVRTIVDGDITYSFASSTGAGAGNRYEETVYALSGTSPCVAVRYFIHYGVIENYPAGAVREFDKQSLIAQFDSIRRTLIIAP